MPLWGSVDQEDDLPKFHTLENKAAGETANLYANVTLGAVQDHQVVGLYGVDVTEANLIGKGVAPGWVLVRSGTGPVLTIGITDGGTGFGNLGVVSVSNGVVNAHGLATTNSTGGITAITILDGGDGFVNSTAVAIAAPANAVNAITIGGGTDYANGEVITFSNGQSNAIGTLTTNSTGGITAVTFERRGRGFSNTLNTVVGIATANGTNGNVVATSLYAGSGATLTVTLGGRAGRRNFETLVALGSMTGDGSDDTLFPDS
jgi:hypothetical protein